MTGSLHSSLHAHLQSRRLATAQQAQNAVSGAVPAKNRYRQTSAESASAAAASRITAAPAQKHAAPVPSGAKKPPSALALKMAEARQKMKAENATQAGTAGGSPRQDVTTGSSPVKSPKTTTAGNGTSVSAPSQAKASPTKTPVQAEADTAVPTLPKVNCLISQKQLQAILVSQAIAIALYPI